MSTTIYDKYNHFNNSKYTKWYFSIIENAKKLNRTRKDSCYYEKHHIFPKCIYPEYSKTKENLVLLTAREHFLCHVLLTKMTCGDVNRKMFNAVSKFCQASKHQKRNFNSWEYKKIRESCTKARIGIKRPESTVQKIKDNHHDVSGANNPRAKYVKCISPNGQEYVVYGEFKKFCKQNQLAYSSAVLMLRKGRILKGSTEGWQFFFI